MNKYVDLRSRISAAQAALEQAELAGHEHEIQLHSVRLRSLVDRATALGMDVSGLVHPQVLSGAMSESHS